MKLPFYLGIHSRATLLTLGILQVAFVGILDYMTGPNIAFSIFYLFPILLGTFSLGRREGFFISIISAVAWFVSDLLGDLLGPTPHAVHPMIMFWNALVGLNFFIIITYTISALREQHERQSDLTQFMVHDLRSPLSNIIVGLKSLSLLGEKEVSNAQKIIISRTLTSSNSMLTLINSMLDLSQLESGNFRLELSQIPVRELVNDSLEQVTLLAEHKKIALVNRLSPDIATIYADRMLTIRILVNLLVNAVKFTPEGKTITIEVTPGDNSMAVFSVSDEGRGIPKEWVPKIFDKFTQVDARKAGAGSGLGLTFCRMGVKAQGGRIWVESELGLGTRIRFALPLRAKSADSKTVTEESPSSLPREKHKGQSM